MSASRLLYALAKAEGTLVGVANVLKSHMDMELDSVNEAVSECRAARIEHEQEAVK